MNIEVLPQPARAMRARQRLQVLLDVALGWLPLLVLGALLLVTVWLVRTAPTPVQIANVKAPQHVADYDIQQFTLNTYNMNGQLKSSMRGAAAAHYEDSLITLVQQPQLLMYSKEGQVTSATAKRALSNEDGSEVQLIGQAEIYRAASLLQSQPLRVKSEFLYFFANSDRMQTDVPVVVTRGDNSFRSDKLRADNLNETLNMKGRVKVVLHPEHTQP